MISKETSPSFPPLTLEIHYEDLHFVAVFLALLAAVAAVLISLMWVCNRCAYKFQRKRRHKLKGNPLGLVIHQFPVLRSQVIHVILFIPKDHLVASFQLVDLSFALQKAQLRRLSYRMLSVSQGWAQLHSYLKRKTFSSQRNKHSKFILQLPVVLPFNPSLMGEPEGNTVDCMELETIDWTKSVLGLALSSRRRETKTFNQELCLAAALGHANL